MDGLDARKDVVLMTEEEKAAQAKKEADEAAALEAQKQADEAKKKSLTLEEAMDALKETRGEAAKSRKEKAELKKQLDELAAWKTEQEDKEKTELQKATDEKAKLEAQVADLTAKQKEIQIKAEFTIAASKAGVTDIDAAYKLADLAGITAEDGTISGLPEAIDALTKERPYLVGSDAPAPTAGNPPTKGEPEDAMTATFRQAAGLKEAPKA